MGKRARQRYRDGRQARPVAVADREMSDEEYEALMSAVDPGEVCCVCGGSVEMVGSLRVGNADGERAYCRACGELSFPGVRSQMIAECPECAAGRH